MTSDEHLRFVKAFMRHPKRIGAIAPSSPALARVMVAGLEVGAGESVVELGPGTGPFTRAIRELLPQAGGYLGIERSPAFVAELQQRFPDMRFVEGSAEHAEALHQQMGLPPVKAVLCGLPFASLPAKVAEGVIRSLDRLMPHGIGAQFRTFQYVHAYPMPAAVRFRHRMTELFGGFTRTSAVLRNLPPAYVLRWER